MEPLKQLAKCNVTNLYARISSSNNKFENQILEKNNN